MSKFFLGIDVGTYESKGVLIDESCRVVAGCSRPHGIENPKPNYFEHDAMKVWWGDFCHISQKLIEDSGVNPGDIAAVGSSALGADLVAVDEHCVPLDKAILYGIDARADKEIEYMNNLYGEDKVIEFNGRPLCSNDIPPKILWLKNNKRQVYDKASKFLTGSSFLTARLTGNYVIDPYLAYGAFTPLYNPATGEIDHRYCEDFCRPDQLATVHPTTDIAGYVTKQAAEETGLSEGTCVIVGADDSGAEAISTGVLEKGDMMVQIGSSMFMIALWDRLIKENRLWKGGFIIPGVYSISAGTNNAGVLTRWFRDNIYPELVEAEKNGGPVAYQTMLEKIKDIPPGAEGLMMLPYLAGERTPINDPKATGMVMGWRLNHTRDHLYKAALESVGYSLAQHLNIIKENNVEVKNIYAVGGGTKAAEWMQILSDITGRKLQTAKVTVGACYGDALMAAIGSGYIENFASLRQYVSLDKIYEPDMGKHSLYKPLVERYTELYKMNKDIMHCC